MQDAINELNLSISLKEKEYRHLDNVDRRAKIQLDDQTMLIVKLRNENDLFRNENERNADNIDTMNKEVSFNFKFGIIFYNHILKSFI